MRFSVPTAIETKTLNSSKDIWDISSSIRRCHLRKVKMDVKRLDFIWRLVAMSVTSFSSWFHGCVNCFLAWGLYLAPLLNQTLIRILRHFMPILKAFLPEMSVVGLRTFFINQYQRIQALRLAFIFSYYLLSELARTAKYESTKNVFMDLESATMYNKTSFS